MLTIAADVLFFLPSRDSLFPLAAPVEDFILFPSLTIFSCKRLARALCDFLLTVSVAIPRS